MRFGLSANCFLAGAPFLDIKDNIKSDAFGWFFLYAPCHLDHSFNWAMLAILNSGKHRITYI